MREGICGRIKRQLVPSGIETWNIWAKLTEIILKNVYKNFLYSVHGRKSFTAGFLSHYRQY